MILPHRIRCRLRKSKCLRRAWRRLEGEGPNGRHRNPRTWRRHCSERQRRCAPIIPSTAYNLRFVWKFIQKIMNVSYNIINLQYFRESVCGCTLTILKGAWEFFYDFHTLANLKFATQKNITRQLLINCVFFHDVSKAFWHSLESVKFLTKIYTFPIES